MGRNIRGEEMRGKKGESGRREGEETTRVVQETSRKREVMRQKGKLKEQEQTRVIKVTIEMDKKG